MSDDIPSKCSPGVRKRQKIERSNKRIEIDESQAEVIRRIFEWVAQGVGLSTLVKRLNAEGIPGTRGKRWSKGAVHTVVSNERYLGRQIWGQQSVEHEPGTGRRIKRDNPRDRWHVLDRPDLRIIADDLWARAHATRAEIRAASAPKGTLSRGRSAKHHSNHLITGFAKCSICGGAISSVSGGKGESTIRLSAFVARGTRVSESPDDSSPGGGAANPREEAPGGVAEARHARLHRDGVEREVKKALAGAPKDVAALRRRLEQEQRKLQHLVSALEAGSWPRNRSEGYLTEGESRRPTRNRAPSRLRAQAQTEVGERLARGCERSWLT